MGSKILRDYELPDYKLSISGKNIESPIENYRPYEMYETKDKFIVFFAVVDSKGKHTNSNVIAFDRHGNQLWRVQPVFSEDVARTGAYVGIGFDEKTQRYRLDSFHGETVELDIETGKITRLGIYSR